MELGEAKRRCRDVIERIERLPAAISACCRRTLLKLAHSELSFLSRCCTASTPLLSVNIGHLEAVVHILHLPSVTAVSRVCKPLPLSSSSPPLLNNNNNVHVDIVCTLNRKPVWIIVSDRNPTSITWNHQSQTNKGLQFRLHQLTAAASSSSASSLIPSSLILFFSHGLTTFLSHKLIHEFSATPVHLPPHSTFHFDLIEDANDWVHVLVARTYHQASVFEIKLKDDDDAAAAALCLQSHVKVSPMAAHWEDTTLLFPAFTALLSKMHLLQTMETGDSHVVNFDTTALIALVSAISNGGTQKLLAAPETELRHRFKGNYDFVIGQVMSEIQNPILVELGSAISGKQGIICETVHSEFKELVLMYGGPNEKLRASHLLKHLRFVPDSPSKRMMSLPTTRKLALKCKVVFGTGDYWCAPTATANMAFVRAVSQAGMSLSTIEHGPRALTGD